MLEVKKFKSMNEVLKQQKELERACSDEDILDEVKDNIYLDLVNINKFITDIRKTKMTNQTWLELLLNILNSRQDRYNYKLQVISGTKSHEKVYTFENFNKVEVKETNEVDKWNAAIIVRSDIDIIKLTSPYENGSVFFMPSAYKEYYRTKLFVTYDTFKDELCIPSYLAEEKSIEDLLMYGEECGLTEKEVKKLNEIVFALYKEQRKDKKRVLKR